MAAKVADRKILIINSILGNPVYTQSSGVYQEAEAALKKMSIDTLNAIALCVEQNVRNPPAWMK